MSDQIDITGLSKAAVLAALYNASRPQGLGMLRAEPGDMDEFEAAKFCGILGDDRKQDFPGNMLNRPRLSFDYLKGRVLKVDLTGDSFDPWGFDRDNGQGAAAAAIAGLRAKAGTQP